MNPLTRLDVFYCGCLITDILTVTLLHTIIRTFIRNKPEGKKTVIAKIYISCSYFWQALVILSCPVFLYRILFGTISVEYLIIMKFAFSCVFNSAIFILAFANVIKIFFLVDYGRMSNVPDNSVMIILYIFISCFVVGGIFLENFIEGRFLDGPGMIYLGDENSRGKIPDFRNLSFFIFIFLVFSLLILFICQIARYVEL